MITKEGTTRGLARRAQEAAVRNPERRPSVALQTMTDDEGLSLREARRFGRRRNHPSG
jgi:hypothetical protein